VDLEAAAGVAWRNSSHEAAPWARVHAGLEEAVGAAAVALGAVQRKVGILEQLVEMPPSRAPSRPMLASVEISDRRMVAGSPGRSLPPAVPSAVLRTDLDDGEFVLAEPCGDIGLIEAAAQAPGDTLNSSSPTVAERR
jgi:hypothetical protein